MSVRKALQLVVVLAFLFPLKGRAEDPSSRSHMQVSSSNKKEYGLTDLAWKFKFGGISYNELKDEGAAAIFEADLKFDYRIQSWLKVFVQPHVSLYSSRLQQRYENDNYENHFSLSDAYLDLQPVANVELQAGALSQEFLDEPLLISQHRTFPGFRETLSTETKPINAKVIAQQLVPTSYSLNDEREGKEPLPSFQTQSLHVNGEHGEWKWQAFGGHYSWARLPDKVAYESARVGNTPLGGGDAVPGARLAYGFDGTFWGGEACLCGDRRWQLGFGYQGLHNGLAPSAYADGQMLSVSPRIIVGNKEFEIKYHNYFIESDATVGLYSRSLFGYTNRMGDIIEASVKFRDHGFKIVGQWVNARTVADGKNTTQGTLSEYNIWVETEYAPF